MMGEDQIRFLDAVREATRTGNLKLNRTATYLAVCMVMIYG